MKRILFMILPLIIVMLAFRPVTNEMITGIVTDEKGNPLAQVSIVEKGTKNATMSGADGSFSIRVSSSKATLIFSSVGFASLEVKLNQQRSLNITLKASTSQLNEVVVIGYGSQKRRNITASSITGVPGANTGYYQYHGEADREYNTEGYDYISENRFHKTGDQPLSTFSIDVDAASYSNVRRMINNGTLPPAGAVRIEEMINYFKYNYPQPDNDQPFSINTEISYAPWNNSHRLVLIGLQGKKIDTKNLPASNLVFLVDVSGSMGTANKLPLVKQSMKMLVDQLREQDKVSIVVYAGAAGLVLSPTSGYEKTKIKEAIERLESGGSTAGGEGIRLAYKTAREHFMKSGNNRVILCTDGDFNVGESSDDAMERLIEKERASGVFLTVLGFGMGNYKDNKMQKLANKGNGNHAYIDGISEARKVLVSEFGGTLFTIAKDVKLQVEFNPAKVAGYRLIGYENRMLAKEDFNNDKKDAGELGSGHTVTALYEVIPAGVKSSFLEKVDDLKYQKKSTPLSRTDYKDEIMTVKFRYKDPAGEVSKLIEHPVTDQSLPLASASTNFRFAAAVAEFGMLLRGSEFRAQSSYEHVVILAEGARGKDEEGYRAEFIRMVKGAGSLAQLDRKKDEKESLVKSVSGD